jgi:hypothetical protein
MHSTLYILYTACCLCMHHSQRNVCRCMQRLLYVLAACLLPAFTYKNPVCWKLVYHLPVCHLHALTSLMSAHNLFHLQTICSCLCIAEMSPLDHWMNIMYASHHSLFKLYFCCLLQLFSPAFFCLLVPYYFSFRPPYPAYASIFSV